mmetsp:Transcript_31957/g.69784  ORF Transcript_31957/g.69784 Transcript_31957/m.69784 type:complete len:313 (-) Transcript_31957:140-1078(-)|eukprot:CAMPEP_0118947700 /NCGR_PEP_ID=MMETSP1169-20130426/46520_1 /TAXON_ID=36882 /ORGANISM="Pyramimonas obovata, Strain CCMP722" /LENGTH=312 /DNA_ID=CAMNT_0006893967 /DNA_START=80 /DNA_END=1018 /DNA_ORIENTATION=+
MSPPELEIKLSRVDRVFCVDEPLEGKVVMNLEEAVQHSGVKVTLMGHVTTRISEKASSVFSMFDTMKPMQLLHQTAEISPAGKLPHGKTEIPFSIQLQPDMYNECRGMLYETYHGVNVSIQYGVSVDVQRGALRGGPMSTGLMEFVLELPKKHPQRVPTPLSFTMTNQSESIVSNMSKLGEFEVQLELDSTTCALTQPVTGTIKLVKSEHKIASIDLQLVRKEDVVVGSGDNVSEISEVQSVQLADGDICRDLEIPIYMMPPRLFSCPLVKTTTFSVNFELNLVVAFDTVYQASDTGVLMAAYKFPITIYRG